MGGTECVREFYAPIGNNLGTGSLLAEVNNPNNNESPISVQLRRGDDVLCELGISKPVVLKIDVEGAEKEVLESIPKFLSAVEPIVIMEISPVTRQAFGDDNGLKSLFGPGYDLFTVKRYRNRYKLAAFAFDRANGNILALPNQHAAALRHKN